MTPDKFFAKIGMVMGMGDSQAKVFVGVFIAAASIAVYLGVGAAYELVERANPSDAAHEDESRAWDTPTALERLESRAAEPVTLEVDKILPDGPLGVDGRLVLCGSHLVGGNAEYYGWLWIEDESLCRRMRALR